MMKDWKISPWNRKQENDAFGIYTQLVLDPSRAVRQENEIITHPDLEGRSKNIFADGMILYIENPKEYFKKH